MAYFIGLDPPPELRDELALRVRELWAGKIRIRWVHPDNYHLTLSYLGDIPQAATLSSVRSVVEAIARRHAPLRLRISRWGGFPEPARAQVLWVGVVGAAAGGLSRLARECSRELTLIPGLSPVGHGKRFVGHITLGRFDSPARIPGMPRGWPVRALSDAGRFVVPDLVLYESRAAGGRYSRLLRVPFTGAAASGAARSQ